MKRSEISKRLQPLADRFAKQLAGLLEARVEVMLAQVEQAFDVALSAAAAELEGTPVERGCCSRMAHAGDGHDQSCSKFVREFNNAAQQLRDEDEAVASVIRTAAPQSRPARVERAAPHANGKTRIVCRKCGFVGGNARGCGRAHATVKVVDENQVVAAEKPTKLDRFARIEESARKRAGFRDSDR